jgi:N-acetylmuramoyl-L-alanine amidase
MKPTHIIIHHSLTEDGQTVSWNAIRKYHLQQGWQDIGYHYGVELIGDHYEILLGRMPGEIGAHCKEAGMNQMSIGICLVGNFDIAPPPKAALDKLVQLVRELRTEWNIPIANIHRHSEFATYKSCPGKLFPWTDFIGRI